MDDDQSLLDGLDLLKVIKVICDDGDVKCEGASCRPHVVYATTLEAVVKLGMKRRVFIDYVSRRCYYRVCGDELFLTLPPSCSPFVFDRSGPELTYRAKGEDQGPPDKEWFEVMATILPPVNVRENVTVNE
jgi:hypothetical protein